MNRNTKEIQRRTVGYWFSDGLVDLFVGGIFLILGIFLAISGLIQPGFLTALTVGIGQPMIILVGFLLGKKFIPILKDRYVYPRTGYITYKQKPGIDRWKRVVIALIVSGMISIAFILILPSLGEEMIWFFSGLMLAIFVLFLSFRTGLIRYIILGGVAILTGAMVSVIGISSPFQSALFYGVFGAAWVIQGAIVFTLYLKNNSSAPEER